MDNNEREYPLIQVYILTYNRPETVLKALDSVLKQTYPNVELILSDNSTNDKTFDLLRNRNDWGKYKYIRRRPSLPSTEHFNIVYNEISSDYYMVFHDDDEMLPNMVEKLYGALSSNTSFSAAGANAYITKNTKKRFAFPPKNELLMNGEDLLRRYINNRIAPFPSYMFRNKIMREIKPDYNNKGGKYCDVSYLYDIANCGPIIYVGEPLMIYNIHPGQDSGDFDFLMHIQLTNYLKSKVSTKSLLNKYRLYNLYRNAVLGFRYSNIKWRPRIATLLLNYSAYDYFVKYVIRFVQSFCFTISRSWKNR